jgi:hypothetical protein
LSFFPPSPEPGEPEVEPPDPPWFGPPRNELGIAVPERVVIARTDAIAIALTDLIAYSTGVRFELTLRAKDEHTLGPRLLFALGGMGAAAGDDMLRFGVAFADGRKATDIGAGGDGDSPTISLVPNMGGGGGGRTYSHGYWLHPLPPPGPVTFAVRWPGRGIALTTHELDAGSLIDAGSRSERLWDDLGPVEG